MSNVITTSTAAKDVAALLASLGHGALGTDLFRNKEPDSPDDLVTVYNTAPWRAAEVAYGWEYPGVQVRVRNRAWEAGEAKALALMNALHCYAGEVGGVKYHLIRAVNGPVPLGEDERGRPRWTFNLEIHRST